MKILLLIISIYTTSFFIRNLDGPFDIFLKTRKTLFVNKYVGVFSYNLLSCPWCLGFHLGYLYYLTIFNSFTEMFYWAMLGSFSVAFLDKIFEKLESKI